jgi:CheY-like chemotaxis protein
MRGRCRARLRQEDVHVEVLKERASAQGYQQRPFGAPQAVDSRENRIVPATILIVDDDQTLRELLQLHLRNAGYTVHVAEDAVEAGHLILRQPPDLIISDVNMPHMDGFEFIAAVRADNSLPYIPVIFLTSEEEGDIRGKELGAVGYVAKPIRADRLLELVAKHVPGGRHLPGTP